MKNCYILFLCIFFYCYPILQSLHLNRHNIHKINKLIQYSKITDNQREIINRILYLSFEKFAVKNAIDFKKKHSYKCSNIKLNELILSSKFGLYKGVRNYKGNSNLINYFYIYIHYELLDSLTEHFSNSIIPKKERIKSKHNLTEYNDYNDLLYTNIINYNYQENYNKANYNHRLWSSHLNKKEEFENMWDKINNFEPFSKRIFYLKYDYDFNIIRSNERISILMCCSEEHIRQKLLEKGKLITTC